jgi:hypothetical protein
MGVIRPLAWLVGFWALMVAITAAVVLGLGAGTIR